MREYEFLLTRLVLYKDRIVDFVFIQESKGQWKPYSRIFYAVMAYWSLY